MDVGGRQGGAIELLHSQVTVVVDVDPDRHSLINHRAPTARRVTGLMEQLPFSDDSFDLVVCSWVLKHLTERLIPRWMKVHLVEGLIKEQP